MVSREYCIVDYNNKIIIKDLRRMESRKIMRELNATYGEEQYTNGITKNYEK